MIAAIGPDVVVRSAVDGPVGPFANSSDDVMSFMDTFYLLAAV
jgi:hypothetical protein